MHNNNGYYNKTTTIKAIIDITTTLQIITTIMGITIVSIVRKITIIINSPLSITSSNPTNRNSKGLSNI